MQAINTSLTKSNQTLALTAREALSKERMDDFFTTNEARLFLRTIRSSPQFWEWKKSEINAMIRQLGCPTFFITFSPAEIDWLELIVILFKVLLNQIITIDEAKSIGKDDRIFIVSQDPVTVSRYFENRIMELLKYINFPAGPFSKNLICDYFWRDDFNTRGSPHVHMLTWNNNAPKYLTCFVTKKEYDENTKLCCQFIDQYITCSRPMDSNFICDDGDEDNDNENEKDADNSDSFTFSSSTSTASQIQATPLNKKTTQTNAREK